MVIDPSLGIRPANLAPLEANQQQMMTGLQQLGLQLRNDLQTIQTNRQLQSFGQQLQDIRPDSNDFAPQIVQAIAQNPLAAHSPAGIAIINQLGDAHKAYIQTTLLAQKLRTGQYTPGEVVYDDQGNEIGVYDAKGAIVPKNRYTPRDTNAYVPVQQKDKYGNTVGVQSFNRKTGQFESTGLPAPGGTAAGEGDLTAQPKAGDPIIDPNDPQKSRIIGQYKVNSKGDLEPSYYPQRSDGSVASKVAVYSQLQDNVAKKFADAAASKAKVDSAGFLTSEATKKQWMDEYNAKLKEANDAKKELDEMKSKLGLNTDAIPGIPPPAPAGAAGAAVRQLDRATAQDFLKQANGDVNAARKLARDAGYGF